MTPPIQKAMLFAAGLGTRLKPFTDYHPKALAIVKGKPLLQRNIEYLKSFGIEEIIVNVHHFADQIETFLETHQNFGISIRISDERNEVLETGGGLVKAQDWLKDESFIVMNVDILTDLDLNQFIAFHQQKKSLVTLAVSDRESSRKLLFEENKNLKGWKNTNTGEEIIVSDKPLKELAFSGVHIIEPTIFNHLPKSGKFSIMKSYMELMKSEKLIGFDHSGGILIDVGKPESLKKAETLF